MATQPKKMNIIKQVLTGHKNGLSVRKMAEMYSMSPTTVQRYLKMANEDSLGVDGLLRLEDPELNHRFNGGNPAYCDERFEDFKQRLPHFEQELKKPHMTTHLLWEEYRKDVPGGYGLTQFRFHLKQNVSISIIPFFHNARWIFHRLFLCPVCCDTIATPIHTDSSSYTVPSIPEVF